MLGNPKPLFTRPELLLHPQIPKPLHGLAPRVLKGDPWWNKVRKEAYAKNNFCCWACGIHKSAAKDKKWLEGHEYYDINYKKGCVKLVEIVALCHFCHNYIHDGRLQHLLDKGEITQKKVSEILKHGETVLRAAGFKKFKPDYPTGGAKWSDWHLLLEGEIYKTLYKNIQEWANKYDVDLEPLGIPLDIDWQLDVDSMEEWNLF